MSGAGNRRACPACGGTAYRRLLAVRGTAIEECCACGLATWDWGSLDIAAIYDASYWHSTQVGQGYADYFSLAGAMGRTHAKRLARLTRHLHHSRTAAAERAKSTDAPKLLDAGCGPGFFVQAAQRAGFDAAGVEISEYAATFAREQLRVNVWRGQVRAADLRGGPYDVVTLWDVVEHLPDPADALAAVAATLRPGGLVALSTGDLSSLVARISGRRWHLFNLPEHLWFFTRRSLVHLLGRIGLHVIECRYEVGWYTVRYLLERVESMFWRRRVFSPRLGAIGRLSVPLTLGDVVTVLARK